MKILKVVLIAIVALIALALVVAAVLPSQAHVERSIVVDAPDSAVYAAVADFTVWEVWNPWTKMEPGAERSISGEPGTVGSTWRWSGDTIGIGSLTIAEMDPYASIRSKLVFEAPRESQADDIWRFESVDGGTRVTWIYDGPLGYPVERLFGPFLDGMLGPQYEQGLSDLKEYVESQAAMPADTMGSDQY